MTSGEDAKNSTSSEHVSSSEPSASRKPGSGLMGRRRTLAVAAVTLTAIAGVTGIHAASASVRDQAPETPQIAAPSPGFEEDLWRRQELLSDLRTWIEAQPGIGTSGYVTSINNPEAGSTILAWNGPSNKIQHQIMDEARRRNILISIQQRKYSMADLQGAADEIMSIDSDSGVFHNFKIQAVVTFDTEFDGVVVQGDYIDPPAEGITSRDAALVQALTAMTDVAVAIEHTQIENL